MDTIGERLRLARKEKGFTMRALHDLTGLSTGNISDLENNRYAPSVVALIPLSQALEKSIDWILTGAVAEIQKSERTVFCDGVPLSEYETDLIAMVRVLDERGQEDVLDYVTMKYEKATGEKVSIYSTYIEDEEMQRKSGLAQGHSAQGSTA